MTMTATYSPEDNKLRLYPVTRLDAETYTRVKAAGFSWAPKQELFVAPAWTPSREDLLLALCGEIGDEDTSLVERAEARAERFEDYAEARKGDAEVAQATADRLADVMQGQPILVGHHSEKHHRRDIARMQDTMRRSVKLWDTATYWQDRAKGAVRAAKYKEAPPVRARRIKGLEADERKQTKMKEQAEAFLRLWGKIEDPDSIKRKDGQPTTVKERALYVANHDHVSACFPLADFPRVPPASQYEGSMSLWSALDGDVITPEQAQAVAIPAHGRMIASCNRWLSLLANRLTYERAMLAESGGIVTDRTGPEVGGACACWASPRGGWSYIVKVNKVSVTVWDNWGNGGGNFTRTIPFDKLCRVMSADEVQAARDTLQLIEVANKIGFVLRNDVERETP